MAHRNQFAGALDRLDAGYRRNGIDISFHDLLSFDGIEYFR